MRTKIIATTILAAAFAAGTLTYFTEAASTRTPASVKSDSELKKQLYNSSALFRRLDSNGDGMLSPVEFARIPNALDLPTGPGNDVEFEKPATTPASQPGGAARRN